MRGTLHHTPPYLINSHSAIENVLSGSSFFSASLKTGHTILLAHENPIDATELGEVKIFVSFDTFKYPSIFNTTEQ
jgi:hypothetical protein